MNGVVFYFQVRDLFFVPCFGAWRDGIFISAAVGIDAGVVDGLDVAALDEDIVEAGVFEVGAGLSDPDTACVFCFDALANDAFYVVDVEIFQVDVLYDAGVFCLEVNPPSVAFGFGVVCQFEVVYFPEGLVEKIDNAFSG